MTTTATPVPMPGGLPGRPGITGFDPATEFFYEKLGFKPSPEQARIIACPKRYVLVTGGEQGGKSVVASKIFLDRWIKDQCKWQDPTDELFMGIADDTLLYWLVGAAYSETEREFAYIAEDLIRIGLAVDATKRVDPGYIEAFAAKGAKPILRIETKSATDPRRLSRQAPHGIIGCEAGQLDITTFERMRGRTAPKKGWMVLTGTIERSSPWYPQMAQAWSGSALPDRASFTLPTWSNRALYPGGRQNPEILALERESSDDFFMERIAGKPVPPEGLVFKEFRADLHVRDVDYVPGEAVHIWIDPGYAGAYAVMAAHIIKGQVQVFDEIYEQGMVTEEIIKAAKERRWWKDVRHGAIDIAGTQHQALTPVAEVWLRDTGLRLDSHRVLINDGIERLKGFLKPDTLSGEPKIVFSPACRGIISEFGAAPNPFDNLVRAYRWKLDSNRQVVGDTPIDMYNHSLKAVIYGLISWFGFSFVQERQKIRVKRW